MPTRLSIQRKRLWLMAKVGNPIRANWVKSRPSSMYFIYIKENRTYDQVLGDMPEGNGDTSLCIFGRRVTP